MAPCTNAPFGCPLCTRLQHLTARQATTICVGVINDTTTLIVRCTGGHASLVPQGLLLLLEGRLEEPMGLVLTEEEAQEAEAPQLCAEKY